MNSKSTRPPLRTAKLDAVQWGVILGWTVMLVAVTGWVGSMVEKGERDLTRTQQEDKAHCDTYRGKWIDQGHYSYACRYRIPRW